MRLCNHKIILTSICFFSTLLVTSQEIRRSTKVTPVDNNIRIRDSLQVPSDTTSHKIVSIGSKGDTLYYRDSKKWQQILSRLRADSSYYPLHSNPAGYINVSGFPTITLSGDVSGSGTTNIPVSVNALAGQPASYYLNRSNQTGFQDISTITGLPAALDSFRTAYDSAYFDSTSQTLFLKKINGNIDPVLINVATGGNLPFDGNRPITRNFSNVTGVNLNTATISTTLETLLYPSQPPTSALTVTYSAQTGSSLIVEKTSSGTTPITLNWTAGRQSATQPINTIVVGGVGQSFIQPPAPGTVSGNQSQTVTNNTNSSWNNIVTTADAQTATSTSSITWQTKWYYGFVPQDTTAPADVTIQGLSGQSLTPSKSSIISVSAPGINVTNSTPPSRFVVAIDNSLDPSGTAQIWIGGLNSTGAFTRTVRSFTNASGFATNYEIFVQSTVTSGDINFQIK